MGSNKEVEFHNRLRALRTEHSISRKELADAVGVHPQTIGYIERRQYNLSLSLAFRLAAHFGLTLDAVFALQAVK
jgi:putative transcriptional regulator